LFPETPQRPQLLEPGIGRTLGAIAVLTLAPTGTAAADETTVYVAPTASGSTTFFTFEPEFGAMLLQVTVAPLIRCATSQSETRRTVHAP
jgi:hypothetical protein